MDTLRTLSLLLPLALTSGINLYLTILVVGLSIRLQLVTGLPQGLDVLAAWPVLAVAALIYIVEFLADKVQFVDNLWDVVHTVIRPLGAAYIGIAALGDADPVTMVVVSLVMGGTALVSHGGKTGGRVALNVSSPAENISNIFVSLAEDALVGGLSFIALSHPYIALGVSLVILLLIIILLPPLMRWTWFILKAGAAWLRRLGHAVTRKTLESDPLPSPHLELLQQEQPMLTSRCKAQNIRGANGRDGFVSATGAGMVFTYDTWTGSHLWQIAPGYVTESRLVKRLFVDVLELRYQDRGKRERIARFVFLKDRAPLAERLGALSAPHNSMVV